MSKFDNKKECYNLFPEGSIVSFECEGVKGKGKVVGFNLSCHVREGFSALIEISEITWTSPMHYPYKVISIPLETKDIFGRIVKQNVFKM